MAKSQLNRSVKAAVPAKQSHSLLRVDDAAVDPALASLFATSAGAVQAPPKSRYQERVLPKATKQTSDADQDDEPSSASESLPSDDDDDDDDDDDQDNNEDDTTDGDDDSSADDSAADLSGNEAAVARMYESALSGTSDKPGKKRKRAPQEEIEDTYMRKVALEEEKEEEQRQKKRKTKTVAAAPSADAAEEPVVVPQHESLAGTGDKDASEVEKASRTIFLSNVSSECIHSKAAEKTLKKHLESFIADLADSTPPHKIESIRFRSTAFASSIPKRAAFAKKDTMDSTTKSTNAYAVYTTQVAAREAVKRLNGTLLLNRHLHVDSVAHPAKVDHRRCVFVGNLPFVDERENPTEDDKPKKARPSSDVEEGLWVHFGKAGKIESVRVVRDAQTRIGKGFAYIQFHDENGVEAALQLHEKKYPPLLPRILRVTRCKAEKKKDKPRGPARSSSSSKTQRKGGYVAKMTEEQKSMQGRARSMLGKVAKAQQGQDGFMVFEGHRASEKQGKGGLKFKGSGGGGSKKKGPNGRKSRSATWKKRDGGKK